MPNQGRNRGQITADGQTTLGQSNIVLGAGWGASATVAIGTGSNDVAGKLVVTGLVGGGAMAQATATIVITFTSPYAVAPRACLVTTTNDNSIDTGHVTWSATTTALTLTFSLLPVTTKIYTFTYALVA